MSLMKQRKWSAALAAALVLSNVQAGAFARDTQIISPPVAGAADPLKIRKAFQLETDPLVSLVHKDVPVEMVLRGLAQKANLSLIYMVDGARGNSAGAVPSAAGGAEEDPLMALQQQVDAPVPGAVPAATGATAGAVNMVIPYLELKDVPVSEAFALVLQMSGLVGRRVYNSLLITTPERMTKMGFSSPVIKTYTIYNQAALTAVTTGNAATAATASTTSSPLVTQLQTIYKSRGIVPAPDILLDTRTSTLVVVGTQEAIDIADRIIPVLDRAMPQVVVEVKLIELSKTASQELGLSYGFAQDKTGAAFNSTGETGVNPGNPTTGSGESAITFSSLSRFAPNFSVRLNALVRDGQARVMSSPRLTIQHGILATFDATSLFPIISTTQTATTATQTVTTFPIGERVQITPFIDTEQNMVTMKLRPEISTSGASVNVGPQAVPIVNTRNVDTTLRVPDGETVIIGGLMRNSETENRDKIPLLGDIPLLGALFSTTEKSQTEVEIVIMVTPRILKAQ